MGHQTRISLLKIFILIFCFVNTSCGGNVFQESASQSTDDAIFEAVQRATNDGDYAAAVAFINNNPGVVPSTREEKMIFGSALAGNCGVTFTGLVDVIANNMISGTVVLYTMTSFSAITTNANDCSRAQTIIESIGDVNSRTLSENLALFLLGFSKFGTFLKESADKVAPFGTVDGGFNACTTSTATGLPLEDVKDMMSGLAMMLQTSPNLTTYLGTSLGTSLSAIQTACGDSCLQTDPSAIDESVPSVEADILNFRKLIASNESGVGGCAFVSCCPP